MMMRMMVVLVVIEVRSRLISEFELTFPKELKIDPFFFFLVVVVGMRGIVDGLLGAGKSVEDLHDFRGFVGRDETREGWKSSTDLDLW